MKIRNYLIKKPVAALSRNGRVFLNIREEVLQKAARDGVKLRVWGDNGVIDPNDWLKRADRREKVFLRPDEPLILRGAYLEENKLNKLF